MDRRSCALGIVILAAVMDLVDGSAGNIAFPSIQRDLGASGAASTAIVSGYPLALGLLLTVGGWLGDRYGHRRVLAVGTVGFTVASVLCGLAVNVPWLLAARVVQGSAAALMVPQTLAFVQLLYPSAGRARALSVYASVTGLAAAAGPPFGALVTEADIVGLGWRAVFLVNVPVAAVVLCGLRMLPAGHRARRPTGTEGWLAVLLRCRSYVGALLVMTLVFAAVYAFFFVLAVHLQRGLGWTPTESALAVLPWSAGIPVASTLGSRFLLARYGRRVLVAGLGLMAAGIGSLAVTDAGTATVWAFVPSLFVAGLGMGLVIAPVLGLGLADVPRTHAGSASGLLNNVQQLGGAAGMAVLGAVYFSGGFEPTVYGVAALLCCALPAARLLPVRTRGRSGRCSSRTR